MSHKNLAPFLRFLVTFLLLSIADDTRAQYTKQVVAYSGQNVPAVVGATFTQFFDFGDQLVGISDEGKVLFLASFEGAGVQQGVNSQGLFIWQDGVLSLLARQGTAVPDMPGFTFTSISGANMDLTGQVGFVARISDQSSSHDAFFIVTGGSPVFAFAQGAAVDGGLEFLGAALNIHGFNGGRALFSGGLTGVGVNSSNRTAVLLYDSTSPTLKIVARKGSPMPGAGSDFVFDTFSPANALGIGGDAIINIVGATTQSSENIGIRYRWTNGSLKPLEISMIDHQLTAFADARFNSGQEAIYSSTLPPESVWHEGGRETPIMTVGDVADGSNGRTFKNIEAYAILDDNRAVVWAALDDDDLGIWMEDDSGVLRKLALVGDPAPGLADGMKFYRVNNLQVNRSGQIAFADLAVNETTAQETSGFWTGDLNGLKLVSLRGEEIQVAEGDVRTVEDAGYGGGTARTGADGHPTMFSGEGDLLYRATFAANGGWAILVSSSGLVVNSTGDAQDLDDSNDDGIIAGSENSDATCDTGSMITRNGVAEPECTLRAAIVEANAISGSNKITFDIPDTDQGFVPDMGAFVIRPASPLPEIIDPVSIKGEATAIIPTEIAPKLQAAPFAPPMHVIDGSEPNAGPDCIRLRAGKSRIAFLGIQGCERHGIRVEGDDNTVVSNYIGVDPRGRKAANKGDGIHVASGSNNQIGQSGSGNWIAANQGWGIRVSGSESKGTKIASNLVGADLRDTDDFKNKEGGILIESGATDTKIGGDKDEDGNTILDGVIASGDETKGVSIRNNTLAIPVALLAGQTAILPFDLDQNGPSCNPWEGGSGVNGGISSPRLTDVSAALVAGMAKPESEVDLYRVVEGGTEYGRYFAQRVAPLANGKAGTDGYFEIAIDQDLLSEGDLVVATATDEDGNTSEFSQLRFPVLFLPGIGGSWLETASHDADNLWLPTAVEPIPSVRNRLVNDRLVRLSLTRAGTRPEPVGVVADGILEEEIDIVLKRIALPYRDIMEWLEAAGFPGDGSKWKSSFGEPEAGPSLGIDLWRVPNDWRLDQSNLAGNLKKRIEWLTSKRTQVARSCQVDIITHSNGGLIAAAYIKGYPDHSRDHVNQFVPIAAPYLGAPQALAAHTKGYVFELEADFPFDPDWSKILGMARNMTGAYGLAPSRTYWQASAATQTMLQDLNGEPLASYDAVLKFLNTPKSAGGLERNGALYEQVEKSVHEKIDDWRNWSGPPHIRRIVGATEYANGERAAGTSMGWLNDALAWKNAKPSEWRMEPGDPTGFVRYRTSQVPILGPGDETVPLVSSTLGRVAGRNDFSGVKLSGDKDNRWIKEFEIYPCTHTGLVTKDCADHGGNKLLARMTEMIFSSYRVPAAPSAGKTGAFAGLQHAATNQNLLYVSGSSAIGVHVYDEADNHTGPVTVHDFREIAFDVPDLGYWNSESTVTLAIPSGQEFRVEIYAPVEDATIRVTRVLADDSGQNRHVLFEDQAISAGGYMTIKLENGTTPESEKLSIDADGDGSLESVAAPMESLSSPLFNPAVPVPDPLDIQAVGFVSEGGDVRATIRFPDAGGPEWTWSIGTTPSWMDISKSTGTTPDSAEVTLKGSTLATGTYTDTVDVGIKFGAYSLIHRMGVHFTLTASASLARIELAPEAAAIAPHTEIQFTATGFDEANRERFVAPAWTATGGTIDQDGLFMAGSEYGEFLITADVGSGIVAEAVVEIGTGVGIEALATDIPTEFALYQSYPNPFNPTASIPFAVRTGTRVQLDVFDVMGRLVMTLIDQHLAPGQYTVRFDARDLPSGTYFYRIIMAEFQEVGRMVLVR